MNYAEQARVRVLACSCPVYLFLMDEYSHAVKTAHQEARNGMRYYVRRVQNETYGPVWAVGPA